MTVDHRLIYREKDLKESRQARDFWFSMGLERVWPDEFRQPLNRQVDVLLSERNHIGRKQS